MLSYDILVGPITPIFVGALPKDMQFAIIIQGGLLSAAFDEFANITLIGSFKEFSIETTESVFESIFIILRASSSLKLLPNKLD